MRITGGECRGRALNFPSRSPQRPTTDFLRSALFNLIGQPPPQDILDLYAGSGSVGLEALSRGTQRAVFVEKNRTLAGIIKKNAGMCGYMDRSLIIEAEVKAALVDLHRREQRFALVFADPPYNQGFVAQTLLSLDDSPVCRNDGFIVLQHSVHEQLPTSDSWELIRQRKYSDHILSFVRMQKHDSGQV